MLVKSLIAEYLCKNSLQKFLDMEEKVLPKSILSMKKQQSLLGEFNERLKDMTAAYARLPFHCGTDAIPLNPKDITDERFKSHVERMKSGLYDEKSKLVWDKMYSDFLMNYKHIKAFFDIFPMAVFSFDDRPSTPSERRFTCMNKLECINTASMVEVPDACREYFDAVKEVEIAMRKVNEIESKNKIRISDRYTIAADLTSLSDNPVKFADTWLNDGFRVRKQTFG